MRTSDWSSDVCSSDLIKAAQCSRHLLVGQAERTCTDDRMGGFEQITLDNRFECVPRTDPRARFVPDAFPLELEGLPVPYIVTDVLLVDEQLVHGATCPRPPEIDRKSTRLNSSH